MGAHFVVSSVETVESAFPGRARVLMVSLRHFHGFLYPATVNDLPRLGIRSRSARRGGSASLEQMAHLLGAESLHLEYPTRIIFDQVTIGLDEGDRIGIVGRNGDGKSTLIRMLAGRLEPDAGRVTRRGGVTLAMLDQADELDDGLTVAQTIVGDIEEHVWAGDSRARDVIAGLASDIPWEAKVGDLSGGQRRRVALASLLIGDHDVIFLDEPTNQSVERTDCVILRRCNRRLISHSRNRLNVEPGVDGVGSCSAPIAV